MVVGGTKFDKEPPILGYTELKTHSQSSVPTSSDTNLLLEYFILLYAHSVHLSHNTGVDRLILSTFEVTLRGFENRSSYKMKKILLTLYNSENKRSSPNLKDFKQSA